MCWCLSATRGERPALTKSQCKITSKTQGQFGLQWADDYRLQLTIWPRDDICNDEEKGRLNWGLSSASAKSVPVILFPSSPPLQEHPEAHTDEDDNGEEEDEEEGSTVASRVSSYRKREGASSTSSDSFERRYGMRPTEYRRALAIALAEQRQV